MRVVRILFLKRTYFNVGYFSLYVEGTLDKIRHIIVGRSCGISVPFLYRMEFHGGKYVKFSMETPWDQM